MADQSSQKQLKKPPTLSMAYGPGGGALVGIPAKVYTRLSELVGEPFRIMFPAGDAASGHAPLYAAFYGPKPISEEEAEQQFWQGAAEFLPPRKDRIPKMLTANINHTAKKFLDPNITDMFRIRDIQNSCAEMKSLSPPSLAPLINKFEEIAIKQWPHKIHLDKAYMMWEKYFQSPEIRPHVSAVLTHINARTGQMSRLKRVFSKAALGLGGIINQKWATDYLYDASIQKRLYTKSYGDARLADCRGTVFFPAHDIVTNDEVNFFCIKKNMLKPDSTENAKVSKNNHTLIDAVMSSSAHPMAVQPHPTEDGMLCTDSSPWHAFDRNVMRVKRHLAKENPDAKLDLFIFNTGNDVIESVSVAEAMKRQTQLGLPGGFSDGTQMAMIGGNTISGAIDLLHEELGENHILQITPRLIPRTPKEAAEFPSRNVIDTSPSNILALQRRAQKTLIENDHEIRQIALRVADNLYSIDYWDEATYIARREKILSAPVPEPDAPPVTDTPDIFDEIRQAREKRLSHKTIKWISTIFMAASAHTPVAGAEKPPTNDNQQQLPTSQKTEDQNFDPK